MFLSLAITSVALLAYTYAGYPVLIWVLSHLRNRPVRKGTCIGGTSVLIAAHNEVDDLPRKLELLIDLAQDEPIREIWIGLDGCTDGTAEAVRERIQESGIRSQGELPSTRASRPSPLRPAIHILEFETRRGKAAVLNDLMAQAAQPVLVMMDARQRVEEGAIPRLLENFADPQVGVVSGAMVYDCAEGAAQKGAESYWGYETFIRRCESRYWAVPGATGALYAIRRELCGPIPDNTLVDDVLIPMRAVLKGFRCLFEPTARVLDRPNTEYGRENIRKRRTLAGIWQIISIEPKIYSPIHNPAWFQWVSHKFLRLWTPFLLATMLVALGIVEFRNDGRVGWPGITFYCAGEPVRQRASILGWRAGAFSALGLLGAFFGVNFALLPGRKDAWDRPFEARWRK